MDTLLSFNWSLMVPEFIILAAAVLLSILDLVMPREIGRRVLGWFAFVSVLLALAVVVGLTSAEAGSILYDTFVLDAFAKAFKIVLLIGSALVLLLAIDHQPSAGMKPYQGEFYYLFLTALLGGMMMTSSADLITLFVGLELLSVSSYILAGMRKHSIKSTEAAMKYVVNGGISTAIVLFAMSYLYGLGGTTNLYELSNQFAIETNEQYQYIAGLSFFILLVGLSFKLATVPFHMWAPDVYEGSPTPVTAFLSIVSKAAGFALLLRMLVTVYMTATVDSIGFLSIFTANDQYIAVLAGITMLVGNMIALRQRSLKRMLAYSSIGHAGYLLAAVAAFGQYTIEALWFYLIAYVFMVAGALAIVQFVVGDKDDDVYAMAGLYKRAPWQAVSMTIFLLSLAGIPLTAGFIGKLNIFVSFFAKENGNYILAAIMLIATIISYVFYFNVMVHMFARPGEKRRESSLSLPMGLAIGFCLVGTLALGLFPNVLLDFYQGNFADMVNLLR